MNIRNKLIPLTLFAMAICISVYYYMVFPSILVFGEELSADSFPDMIFNKGLTADSLSAMIFSEGLSVDSLSAMIFGKGLSTDLCGTDCYLPVHSVSIFISFFTAFVALGILQNKICSFAETKKRTLISHPINNENTAENEGV